MMKLAQAGSSGPTRGGFLAAASITLLAANTLPASAEIRLRRLAPGSTYQPDQHRLLMPIAPPAGGREYAPVLVDLLSELLPAS